MNAQKQSHIQTSIAAVTLMVCLFYSTHYIRNISATAT